MKPSEEAEQIIAQLEKENQELKNKLLKLVEVKEENKLLKERYKFLEKAFEKLRKELRKYNNENTPSGSLPPYLKPGISIRKYFENIPEEKEEKIDNKVQKKNIRNSRPKKIDRTETLELKRCPKCGGKLHKEEARSLKRIIITLKMPEIETVEYESPRYYCPICDEEVIPKVSNALPKSKFDLTISIFISVLFIGMNMTQGKIAELLSIFGLNISKATVCNILRRLKEYLGDEYEELQKKILNAKAKGKDETSWRHNGKMNWVWVATTAKEVCYWIEEKRNYETVKKIFKGDKGIDTVDGYKGYDQLNKQIQRDWGHLFRIARKPEYWFTSEREIKEYKKLVKKLGKIYHNAKEDKINLKSSKKLREKYEKKLFKILTSVKLLSKNANKLINYIMHYNFDWFTFLEHKEVNPTSNDAERALRHIVIKRKISQQSRSDESKESYAMQLSLYQTCKLRDQNYMKNLKNVVEDKLNIAGKF